MRGKHNWSDVATRIEKEHVLLYFNLFLGRNPNNERELNELLYIAREFQHPRLEIFRYFFSKPDMADCLCDMYPFFIDSMLRARTFAGLSFPLVNFFCIGAARAGTTTLYRLLSLHPDVYSPSVKETNFFSHFYNEQMSAECNSLFYNYYYAGWRKETVICDFSPNYIWMERSLDHISRYNENAYILLTLRHPAERALSDYFYLQHYHQDQDIYNFFRKGIQEYTDVSVSSVWYSAKTMLRKGLYAHDVAKWTAKFKKTLIIEMSMYNDIETLFRSLCNFCELDSDIVSDFSAVKGRKINASVRQEDKEINKTRDMLIEFYQKDMVELRGICGIDFSDA